MVLMLLISLQLLHHVKSMMFIDKRIGLINRSTIFTKQMLHFLWDSFRQSIKLEGMMV